MAAPKPLHKLLDELWDARTKLQALKEAPTRDVTAIADAAKAASIAYDRFELKLNG